MSSSGSGTRNVGMRVGEVGRSGGEWSGEEEWGCGAGVQGGGGEQRGGAGTGT